MTLQVSNARVLVSTQIGASLRSIYLRFSAISRLCTYICHKPEPGTAPGSHGGNAQFAGLSACRQLGVRTIKSSECRGALKKPPSRF